MKATFKNKYDISDFKHMRSFPLLKGNKFDGYLNAIPNTVKLTLNYGEYGVAIMRYMILVYDLQSPYRENIPLLDQRKKEVAMFVGIYKTQWFDVISRLEDETFVDALAEYLKYQNNFAWALIVQNEEVFYSNQRQLLSQLSSDAKDTDRLKAAELQGKLLAQQGIIRKDLHGLYSELTGNDPLAETKIKERQVFTPEFVANFLNEEEE